VALLSGVKEGERVVTTANFLLDSESRLRAAIEGFGAPGAKMVREEDEPAHDAAHEAEDQHPHRSRRGSR
jgi:hypothetical protein